MLQFPAYREREAVADEPVQDLREFTSEDKI